ncbi:MAG: branched-chain amino acid transport system substrate-binding protein, partial [Actinomycetota bacterium]|nr:branched-chain amino acid transport system substrate-binding protein [Actinomycetota bacterium]
LPLAGCGSRLSAATIAHAATNGSNPGQGVDLGNEKGALTDQPVADAQPTAAPASTTASDPTAQGARPSAVAGSSQSQQSAQSPNGVAAAGGQRGTRTTASIPGGGSGEKGPGRAPQPGAPAPTNAMGAPILIGNVGTYSGVTGTNLKAQLTGVQVWVATVNAAGGVNGHPVRLIVGEDGGDSAKHRSLVQKFIEQDKVAAFVGNAEVFTGAGSIDYIQERHVPVVGLDGAESYAYDHSMYFPQMPSGEAQVHALIAGTSVRARQANRTKLATLTCLEATVCHDAARVWAQKAKELGLEMVYQAEASLGQPDFTSQCLQARNAGANLVMFATDPGSIVRFATSCERQNYQPLYAPCGTCVGPTIATTRALDGAVVSHTAFPWTASDTPARQEFQDAMRRYGGSEDVLPYHSFGWTAAKLFEHAVKLSSNPTTPSGILEGLWKIANDDLGGLTYPLTITKDKTIDRRVCWSLVQLSSGRWSTLDDGKIRCL